MTSERVDAASAIREAAEAGGWTLIAPDGRVWISGDLMVLSAALMAEIGQYAPLRDQNYIPLLPDRMVVCPTCGNKRCPHATAPSNACTGSNEPGQKFSGGVTEGADRTTGGWIGQP